MKTAILITIDIEIKEKLDRLTSNKSKYINDLLSLSLNEGNKQRQVEELRTKIAVLENFEPLVDFLETNKLIKEQFEFLSRRTLENSVKDFRTYIEYCELLYRDCPKTREEFINLVNNCKMFKNQMQNVAI